ncbi:MAG: DUF444 family protein [Candidatus Dadabacteria bacterium]|nr:MAG: DUF444 family protein [Candidatus Dadabacteria bacterium]
MLALASLSIDEDLERLDEILKGKARKEIRKYIQNADVILDKGDKKVSVPVPYIDPPKFRFGDNNGSGGQGDGSGRGKAGSEPGEHTIEVELSVEDLAQILGEELELPRIKPKDNAQIQESKLRIKGISTEGPESLRHFKRSYKEALKRQLAEGSYNPDDPLIVPERQDLRYRSINHEPIPSSSAVIFHIIDVSGSMGEEQKRLARSTSFWIDAWIEANYENTEHVFIVHDTEAKEVDKDTFFTLHQAGGTRISSAYQKVLEKIQESYPPENWNIYIFQFSDGDNLSDTDNVLCCELLREKILPFVNLFAYGQVKKRKNSDDFMEAVAEAIGEEENVSITEIPHRQAVIKAIKKFLGKGK